MIGKTGIKNWKRYCREPIEHIAGFEEATKNPGRYECHHINELTFTRDELMKMNMYYNRPASELIIMTKEDHKKWHHRFNGSPMSGRASELSPRWLGDRAKIESIGKRARKLYKKGLIDSDTYNEIQIKFRAKRRENYKNRVPRDD